MKVLLFILILINATFLHAQLIIPDAKASTPIIELEGTILDFNIATSEIKLGFNKNIKMLQNHKNNSFIGIEGTLKNANNIAKLFAEGKFLPQPSTSFFYGYEYNFKASQLEEFKKTQDEQKKELAHLKDKNKNDLRAIYFTFTKNITEDSSNDLKNMQNDLSKKIEEIEKNNTTFSDDFLDYLKSYKIDSLADKHDFVKTFKKDFLKIDSTQTEMQTEIVETNRIKVDFIKTNYFPSISLYGRLGTNFKSFDYIENSNTDTAIFATEKMHGINIQLGANLTIARDSLTKGNTVLSFAYISSRVDNFNALGNIKEYISYDTIKVNNVNQLVPNSKKAYSGDYQKFWRNEFLLSVSRLKRTSAESPFTLLISGTLSIGTKNKFQDYADIDAIVSINFFKDNKSFIGGFYFGVDDIVNSINEDRGLLSTLTFGITTSFSFKKIAFNPFPHLDKSIEKSKAL